jgi:hypothetical protein
MIKSNEVSEYKLNLYSGELTYTSRKDGKEYRYTVADPGIFYDDVNEFVMAHNDSINEQIKAKEQSLENHRELMKKFAYAEKSAAQRDQYLKMIHSDLELSNYLQANQSWIVEIK